MKTSKTLHSELAVARELATNACVWETLKGMGRLYVDKREGSSVPW